VILQEELLNHTKKIEVSDLSYECNELRDDDMKMYNIKFKDMKVVYRVKKIIYSDGAFKPD